MFIETHALLYMSSSLVFQSKELQTEPYKFLDNIVKKVNK